MTASRHQPNREHLESHGFEQEQAMALADVLDGLTADIGAKLEKTASEIKEEVLRANIVIRWMAGLAAGLAGVAAAATVAVLIYLLFAQA